MKKTATQDDTPTRQQKAPRIVKATKQAHSNSCGPRCQYFREIERLREVCLKCTVCNASRSMQCGGRGMIYADNAEGGVDGQILYSIGKTHTSPEVYRDKAKDNAPRSVTPLPPDIEDRVRLLLAAIIGMTPLQALVLHHLANGGNLVNFNEYMARTLNDWDGRSIKDKRAAWFIFQSAKKKCPELDALFQRTARRFRHSKDKGGEA